MVPLKFLLTAFPASIIFSAMSAFDMIRNQVEAVTWTLPQILRGMHSTTSLCYPSLIIGVSARLSSSSTRVPQRGIQQRYHRSPLAFTDYALD